MSSFQMQILLQDLLLGPVCRSLAQLGETPVRVSHSLPTPLPLPTIAALFSLAATSHIWLGKVKLTKCN